MRKILKESSIPIAFFLLILSLYMNQKQRNNINGLAVQAASINFGFRVFLNFMFFMIFLVLYFALLKFAKNNVILEQYRLTTPIKFLVGVALIAISSIPAFIFTSKFQKLSDIFYGFYSIGHQKPNFLDLRGVLSGMNSVESIGENFIAACPGACVEYHWNYPQFLLDLDFINVSEANTYQFAMFFVLLYLMSLVTVLDNQMSILFISAWTLTASSMLLFERMNSEILVPTLVILNLYLLQKYPKALYFLPITILFLANLKFYPLILIPALLIIFRRGFWWQVYNIFIFITGLFMVYDDYIKTGIASISFGYPGTFGLKTYLGLLLGSVPSFDLQFGIPLTIFILLIVFLLQTGYKSSLVIDSKIFPDQLFYLGSTLTLASWILSSNYQYRMATILLLIPYLAKNLTYEPKLVGAIFIGYFISALNCALSLAPMRNAFFSGASLLLLGLFVRLTLSICIPSITRHISRAKR